MEEHGRSPPPAHYHVYACQVAYNADRRRQLWEQTARDDLKELTELRALVRADEEKADKERKEAHARGAEVGETGRVGNAGGQGVDTCGVLVAAYLKRGALGCRSVLFSRVFGPCGITLLFVYQ